MPEYARYLYRPAQVRTSSPARWVPWFSRAVVAAVFGVNVWCAVAFIADPAAYVAGFELAGIPGQVAIQGFGILFLMWNVTYLPVIWSPSRHRGFFAVVLVQQAIGVAGETMLALTMPPGHDRLLATGLRFLRFDAAALVLMLVAFVATLRHARAR